RVARLKSHRAVSQPGQGTGETIAGDANRIRWITYVQHVRAKISRQIAKIALHRYRPRGGRFGIESDLYLAALGRQVQNAQTEIAVCKINVITLGSQGCNTSGSRNVIP